VDDRQTRTGQVYKENRLTDRHKYPVGPNVFSYRRHLFHKPRPPDRAGAKRERIAVKVTNRLGDELMKVFAAGV